MKLQVEKKNRKKKSNTRVPLGVAPKYRHDFRVKDSGHAPEVVRRIVIVQTNSSVATTGAATYSLVNSNGVCATPEFTAIANQGIYREFRVVAMRMRVQAVFQSPVSPNNTGMGPLLSACCGGNNVPPNDVRGLLSSQSFRMSKAALPMVENECDAGLNPSALLWSSVLTAGGTTVVADRQLSMAWRFHLVADALYNAKTVTCEYYEWDVEFRTAG